jgi:hypothetical protein
MLISVSLAACTTLHIENAAVSEHLYPGLVFLSIAPSSDKAAIVRTTGIGLVIGSRSFAFGYLAETQFLISDITACRTFIVVPTSEDVDALKRAFKAGEIPADLCVLNSVRSKHD